MGVALLAAIGSAGSASASTMVPFDFAAPCENLCGVVGLNTGDPVSLTLGVDPSAISPGGTASASSIVYINLNFGAASYSGSPQVSDGAKPSISFTLDGTAFSALSLFGSLSLPTGTFQWEVTGDDQLGFQVAVCSLNPTCGATAISAKDIHFVDVPSVPIPAVPLPAPIWLLLTALGALGLYWRAKKVDMNVPLGRAVAP